MKNLKYTLLILLLILINSSPTWAEAFKGGISNGYDKVLFFLILINIISAIVTVVLLFAYLMELASKYDLAENKKGVGIVLVGSILFLAIYNFVIMPVILLGGLAGVGALIYVLSNPGTDHGSFFLKSLAFLIASVALTALVIVLVF